MTQSDAEKLVERLTRLAALEPGWYANVGRKTGEECCAAMREAASEIAALRRRVATLTNALEDYACAGSPEKCHTTMLRDGSCVRLMAGNCGKPAYEALSSEDSESGTP